MSIGLIGYYYVNDVLIYNLTIYIGYFLPMGDQMDNKLKIHYVKELCLHSPKDLSTSVYDILT